MQPSLFLAFLTALIFHVAGLAVMSFGWQAWREFWPRLEPLSMIPVAVTPMPEPTPPPPPESPPEPVPVPDTDSVPEPMSTLPPLSAPITLPTPVQPPPPKQAETRPKPVPVAPTQHPKPLPARERAPQLRDRARHNRNSHARPRDSLPHPVHEGPAQD